VVRDLEPVPVVLAPRAKVVHVLVNLVKNGIEAMREAPPERRVLTLQLRGLAGQVELRVNDAGVGIAAEQLLQVFRYGFTTKKDGHGFGLHSCANLVARLGGTIHAESSGPERGATFVVRFPASA
jgi:C4-dicarboxylate-specific signal transduction histidine kinase